ncbi:S8 family serine peptidase [Microtetraspora sp. NBRC 16547]|uniref:S8 family serine peptidase n=1 Tax=Microtetraspora sp. NBRC 16547 TaxID=3030993 RepID=UPI0025575B5B|nr:S8 family serine peptidase [Microtetraspora sp. NBRC 16547]
MTAVAGGLALVAATIPAASATAEPSPSPSGSWSATPLTDGELVEGAKSPSGRLAKSDVQLLQSRSAAPVNVVVKLDYDSLAAYRGGLAGLPGTSPAVTGESLDLKSADAAKYGKHIEEVENAFLGELAKKIPDAKVGQKLRTVYGGVALTLPGEKAAELLKLPGVAAVQEDKKEQPLTDSSASFMGADTIYNQLGGSSSSGKGVIVGILDSGAWPEHPSFADPGNLPAPPAKADGTPRTCNFGDNPLTPATDVFVCNNKLISGQPFLDTYNALAGGEVYPKSARDSNGHGTHTATTSAGGPVEHANPLGIDRGAIHGIAPAAHVAVYKVCGAGGCYQSDSAAAVAQAIADGVRVINFSISGGSNPYSDPVELAFLDAYAAGVFVSASAGNSGPGANTTDHRSPWVTTVAASTQSRTFQSTITLAGDGTTTTIKGASITAGSMTPLPIVLASAPPYSDALCVRTPPAGLFTGKIVACERGPNRVLKGAQVKKGGAAGMILYNSSPLDVMTDNHWVPTVHIDKPETDALLGFLSTHPGATATFTQGEKTTWQGDAMTTFSSRGPGGDFLKPDVTAPGLHILAGQTPTPESEVEGPAGNLFQVIAGTSMSSPHVAGAGALVAALHPDWTPGQIKSALETTATTKVTKQDRTTPADPFDYGGGRIDLSKAGDPGLTLDETAANFAASADHPQGRIDLNLPSVNAPVMPGVITAKRKLFNATDKNMVYKATGSTVSGAQITVQPATFNIKAGQSAEITIAISAPDLPEGQYFGQVDLKQVNGNREQHLPVAFYRTQGSVPLEQTCTPDTIAKNTETSTCTVTVRNETLADTEVTASSTLNTKLKVAEVTGATQVGKRQVTTTTTLAGRQPDKPVIAPGTNPAEGWLPLSSLGIRPTPIGDEQALNYNVPAFVFAGKTYTRIGVVSNGYTVAGGTTGSADIQYSPQTFPDSAPPNGVLATYWTDLDGTGAPGVYVATLTDGVNRWVVIEWRVRLWGDSKIKMFQQWIGLNGTEDITYAYNPTALPGHPGDDYGLTVGAENADGTAGSQITGGPASDYQITSTPGAPGGTLTYSFTVKGSSVGTGTVTTATSTPQVRGITVKEDKITVQ